jgi:hypothetical protein
VEFFRAISVHLAVPAAGLFLYLWLCNRMRKFDIEKPPFIPLFILFGAYGGWLMIFLTFWFSYWSGMASLGFFGLILVAPIVMLIQSVYLFLQRNLSKYHYGSFLASVGYICFIAALVGYRVFFWD